MEVSAKTPASGDPAGKKSYILILPFVISCFNFHETPICYSQSFFIVLILKVKFILLDNFLNMC